MLEVVLLDPMVRPASLIGRPEEGLKPDPSGPNSVPCVVGASCSVPVPKDVLGEFAAYDATSMFHP